MTVSWILEGNRERFLSSNDPTPPPMLRRPSSHCPFCSQTFDTAELLNSHIQTSHALRRPFLLIGGIEPGHEDVIRHGHASSALEIFDCTEIKAAFDGDAFEPVSASQLSKRLEGKERGIVKILLSNCGAEGMQPVYQDYRLRIAVPDESSLAGVDEVFLVKLCTNVPDMKCISDFYEETRNGPAAEYAEALGDYVRSVLVKDSDRRTGVSGRWNNYREMQNSALDTLQHFNRPTARLVCSVLRFALNDFSHWRMQTGFLRLDRAYGVLGPIAGAANEPEGKTPQKKGYERSGPQKVCELPVDDGTNTIVVLSEEILKQSRWGDAVERRFSALAEKGSLDPLDRAKIRALWAKGALGAGARDSAGRALRLLDGDPTFGKWAAREMAGRDRL